MIDCPNGAIRDLLPDFLHGRLDASRRAEVELHLAGCEDCREELSLLGDLRATMARAPRVNVDAIAAAIPPYRAPMRRSWATGWRTAAAIAAIAVGGTSIAVLRDGSAVTDRFAASPAAIEVESIAARSSTDRVATAAESSPPRPGAERPAGGAASTRAGAGELAMAVAAIGELSDGELSALVEGIATLDALPSADVEGAEPVVAGVQEEAQ